MPPVRNSSVRSRLPARFHFFHRMGGQRDADGVAQAFTEQLPHADGGFDEAFRRQPGLGNADMQRIVALRRPSAGRRRRW